MADPPGSPVHQTLPTPAPASAPAPRPAPVPVQAGGAAPLGNAATTRSAATNPATAGFGTPPAGSVSLAAETFTAPGPPDGHPASRPWAVPVHLGQYARGELLVVHRADGFHTAPNQRIALQHPALERLRPAGIEPALAVSIAASKVSGHVALGPATSGDAIAGVIKKHGDKLGWAGIDLKQWGTVENTIEGGELKFQIHGLTFHIGSLLDGSLTFGLLGNAVVFDGHATLKVAGQQGAVQLIRDPAGGLTIVGDLKLVLGKATVDLHAKLDPSGSFEVCGTGSYQADKFSGEITVVVADRKVADELARGQLGIEPAGQQAAGGAVAAGPDVVKPVPEHPVPVGWGTLTFAISEWLAGAAKVVIDPGGHLTVIGDITPPAEVTLFEQRDYVKNLFKIEGRAVYGIPVVGNVFVFANIGMDALAKLGPGKLHSIVLSGKYSTNPEVAKAFSVTGKLTISAFAGLRLRAEGGAGIEILDHDIKVGVGVNGLAGVKGYVEAAPTIGMRETGEPTARKTEFYIKGHLEIAAQPFLGLSGDLFVDLDSPWWSPAPDKRWTWPIGSLEYVLPGEFGIAADLDYVLGSGKLPDITFGRASFDSSKFITDLVDDHVPPKSKGEVDKPGQWKEGDTGAPAPGATAEVKEGAAPATGQPPGTAQGHGGRDASGQPAPRTATQGDAAGTHTAKDGHGAVPAPGVEAHWNEGMRTLGELAERTKSEGATQEDIDAELATLKTRFGFTQASAARKDNEWEISVSLNPSAKKRVRSRIYRTNFFTAYPDKEGKVVVHHAVEQQANKRYGNVMSDSEMHALPNLRGVPKAINNTLHLSTIRKEWNEFYKAHSTVATKPQLIGKAHDIDRAYGSQFDPPV